MKKQMIKKAKKSGLTNVDIFRMQETAKKVAMQAEKQAMEKAFLYMLAIPLNILVNDYWQKTAKKRSPKFIEDVLSLYEAVEAGVVTDEQLADFLDEFAGIKIEAEWLKRGSLNERMG